MTIPLKTWQRYKDLLAKIDKRAAAEMFDFIKKIGGYMGHEKQVIDFAFGLATKYGEAAAAAACEMYDAVAAASGVTVEAAVPASTATYNQVAKTVRGVAKASQNTEMLSGAVGRLVKQAGADTTLKNALRDGSEFAWIPSGDTCAFCITLASRGWQRASKGAIKNGHAEHIHANCDCTYAVRFNSSTNVRGYDPDKYREMYDGAEGNTPEEKINSMRRQAYAENKDKINEQKRAAYEKRKELESSAAEEIEATE